MREMILDGIRAKLQPLTRQAVPAGFAVAVVDYPFVMKGGGQDDYELNLLYDILGTRAPAYAIAVGDTRGRRAGAAGLYTGEMQVEVYCVSTNMRHLVEGRLKQSPEAKLDDTADPGIFAMTELCRMYLTDQFPVTTKADKAGHPYGTQVKELRWEGERELLTVREGSLWGVQFSLTVEQQANMLRGATVYLKEIMARHYFSDGTSPMPAPPDAPLISALTEGPPEPP